MSLVGVLPCAGSQTRLKELHFAKELLPLFDGRPVIQHSIDCLRLATPNLIAVVNPAKKDLLKFFKKQNIPVVITRTKGPIDTLHKAAKKVKTPILFALSDTYYEPSEVFVRLRENPHANVIGLFKAQYPERLDSVTLKGSLVTNYTVKRDPPLSDWTMGCGKLDPQAFKHTRTGTEEIIFGNLFAPLTRLGLLYGLKFPHSSFFDLGTPHNYIEYLLHRFQSSSPKSM